MFSLGPARFVNLELDQAVWVFWPFVRLKSMLFSLSNKVEMSQLTWDYHTIIFKDLRILWGSPEVVSFSRVSACCSCLHLWLYIKMGLHRWQRSHHWCFDCIWEEVGMSETSLFSLLFPLWVHIKGLIRSSWYLTSRQVLSSHVLVMTPCLL